MSVLSIVILIFSALGAVDWLIGNKIGKVTLTMGAVKQALAKYM